MLFSHPVVSYLTMRVRFTQDCQVSLMDGEWQKEVEVVGKGEIIRHHDF